MAICADLGHPELGRRYAQAGARLLLVPALDFQVDDWSQSRVQLLRGVESGFSTARASRQGYLTVADLYGRVTAESRADDDGQATVSLTQDVLLGSGPTIYARVGDVFSWLCLIITAARFSPSPARAPTDVAHCVSNSRCGVDKMAAADRLWREIYGCTSARHING